MMEILKVWRNWSAGNFLQPYFEFLYYSEVMLISFLIIPTPIKDIPYNNKLAKKLLQKAGIALKKAS